VDVPVDVDESDRNIVAVTVAESVSNDEREENSVEVAVREAEYDHVLVEVLLAGAVALNDSVDEAVTVKLAVEVIVVAEVAVEEPLLVVADVALPEVVLEQEPVDVEVLVELKAAVGIPDGTRVPVELKEATCARVGEEDGDNESEGDWDLEAVDVRDDDFVLDAAEPGERDGLGDCLGDSVSEVDADKLAVELLENARSVLVSVPLSSVLLSSVVVVPGCNEEEKQALSVSIKYC
jgi:hypothetical protein